MSSIFLQSLIQHFTIPNKESKVLLVANLGNVERCYWIHKKCGPVGSTRRSRQVLSSANQQYLLEISWQSIQVKVSEIFQSAASAGGQTDQQAVIELIELGCSY